MKETTLEQYKSSPDAKVLYVAGGKEGKTVSLLGGLLGVLPWQTQGGVVDKPSSLHILTFDASAVGHALGFLRNSCGAPVDVGQVHVLNLEDDMRRVAAAEDDYSAEFFGAIFQAIDICRAKAKQGGVHAMIFSSLTGAVGGLMRSLSGAPLKEKDGKPMKSTMDRNKWSTFAQMISELQMYAQQDGLHCIWEAHLTKKVAGKDGKGDPIEVDTLLIQGRQGDQFPFNVEQVWRHRRRFGVKHAPTKVDKTYLDTAPSLAFVAGGRGSNELLNAEEPCITTAFNKLGLRVGGYGGKKAAKPAAAASKPVASNGVKRPA